SGPVPNDDPVMDLLDLSPDFPGLGQSLFPGLAHGGQPHLLGHHLRGQFGPNANKADVLGLSIEVDAVHIKVQVQMFPVPMGNGDGLAVLKIHFLKKPLGKLLEVLGLHVLSVLNGGTQHKADGFVLAMIVVPMEDFELPGNFLWVFSDQELTMDDFRLFGLLKGIGNCCPGVRYGHSLAYHFAKFNKWVSSFSTNSRILRPNSGSSPSSFPASSSKVPWHCIIIL